MKRVLNILDANQKGIALFCIRCFLDGEEEKIIADFVWEGQSICEDHALDYIKQMEDGLGLKFKRNAN